jgi:hypothetical protein
MNTHTTNTKGLTMLKSELPPLSEATLANLVEVTTDPIETMSDRNVDDAASMIRQRIGGTEGAAFVGASFRRADGES